MIPKKIHYCRFGHGSKGKLFEQCLRSWKKYCPDREIIERNEENLDIVSHPYMHQAYKDKKRAFVSDMARLQMLYNEGGVYLDTDMELLKPIDDLLMHQFFLAKEDEANLSAGIIGSIGGHNFLKYCLDDYDHRTAYITIPTLLTTVYQQTHTTYESTILNPISFYPYKKRLVFDPSCITHESYGIHWRDDSRNSSSSKVLKKYIPLSVIQAIGSVLEILGLKELVKRLLRL